MGSIKSVDVSRPGAVMGFFQKGKPKPPEACNPPQTVPPTGDQGFKCPRHWGVFLIQSPADGIMRPHAVLSCPQGHSVITDGTFNVASVTVHKEGKD